MKIRASLEYLKYVLTHKWYIFRAGSQYNVSLWRRIKHDWTKLLPCEFTAYRDWFTIAKAKGTPEQKWAFDRAWLHHIHWNTHHWNHWVLDVTGDYPTALEMPLEDVLEMMADWSAVAAYFGTDLQDWYMRFRTSMVMHEDTRYIVEVMLKMRNLPPITGRPTYRAPGTQ